MTKKEYASRYLYGKIQSGEYKVGQKILSENALAIKLQISRLTARQAFKQLESNGIITSKHGKGYFVSDIIGELSFGMLDNSFNLEDKIIIKEDILIENFFGIKHQINSFKSYKKEYYLNEKLNIATVCFLNLEEVWNFKEEKIKESLIKFLINLGTIPKTYKETVIYGSHHLLDKYAKKMGYKEDYPIFIVRLKNEENINIQYSLKIYAPGALKITNIKTII